MHAKTKHLTAAIIVLSAVTAEPVAAQDASGVFLSGQTSGATGTPYVRGSLGVSLSAYDDARWQNGAGDPTISFDFSDETGGFGEIAYGYDWQNGLRADLALGYFGATDASGPCSSASDSTPCSDHANISDASISSTTLMGNVFFTPRAYISDDATFQPYVMAGLGVAFNDVGDWTREANPGSPSTRPFRTFEGDTQSSFAWSFGIGASWEIETSGAYPVILDASWRYFDLGEASGGSTPLPGNGAGDPLVPLTFDNTRNVFSLGIRIPM